MSTSLGPIAMDSMSSLLAAASRVILSGLSSASDLPTVTTSLDTALGEASPGGCAGTESRASSERKTRVSILDQHMRELSAEFDWSFRALKFRRRPSDR